ncbi:putative membrane protein [Fimbriiglobus ruber]|uniref:Putative membrane protein n=2 Tax=Fimbriiglobus ruber TaxID=1908690 RepID=A0A225DE70_9BACT|nr:putative membrane protein [Fimbriiglobus ruber]
MCLTGVDYFSTLGYQPGIAALAAGLLSPVATLVLVALTLFGALPVYWYVSKKSPRGEGSIAMMEHLLPWWQGKLLVLALLGFVATDFTITITLSAADATAHLLENPFCPGLLEGQQVVVTLALVGALGAVFLRGFKEAIGVAVFLVVAYLSLNALVVGAALNQVAVRPHMVAEWQSNLWAAHGSPWAMAAVALLVFPKLALGLSGFETGVAVMPLIRCSDADTERNPVGRIRNTRKLLVTAAVTMSLFLVASSLVTTLLIPADEFQPGGRANGRALAYLAHDLLGEWVGTAYDVVTILILWFAGASAMAGLINIVPRYLPRYGMAPEWTRAARPLALLFTAISVAITLIFRADVDAQAGAYATGVLVLMTSGATAAAISSRKDGSRASAIGFGAVALVFLYTLGANVIERPDGVKIAGLFIAGIVVVSLASRVWRILELRVAGVELDDTARRFLAEIGGRPLHLLAHDPTLPLPADYVADETDQRGDFNLRPDEPVLFLEVHVRDASDFTDVLHVYGVEVGCHRVLRAEATAIPNGVAALLLHLRDVTGKRPSVYFNWDEGSPLGQLIRYLFSGHGDVAPLTREILRRAEPDAKRRPAVYVGV